MKNIKHIFYYVLYFTHSILKQFEGLLIFVII